MKRFIKSKKGIALLATVVIAVAAAVGAYAYYTNTGSVSGTPAAVGSVPLTGTFNVAYGTTTYAGGTALIPTAIGDANSVVATVPFTVTNTSEADELLSSYTIALSGSQTTGGHPACDSSDFAVNGAPYTAPVTVSSGGSPALSTTLKPASDSPANQYGSSFTIQLVDNGADQDSCMNFMPTVTVSATS